MSGQQSALVNLLVPVTFLAMFYFLLIRPNQKREKAIKAMRASLKIGDRVMTIGGIGGEILSLSEDAVVLQVEPDKTRITVEKWGIGRIVEGITVADSAQDEALIEETIVEAAEQESGV